MAGRNCHRHAEPPGSGRKRLRGLLVRRLDNLDVGVGIENAVDDLAVIGASLESVEPELVAVWCKYASERIMSRVGTIEADRRADLGGGPKLSRSVIDRGGE